MPEGCDRHQIYQFKPCPLCEHEQITAARSKASALLAVSSGEWVDALAKNLRAESEAMFGIATHSGSEHAIVGILLDRLAHVVERTKESASND